MNTIPGARLIEPGDRLPLAPCRLQGKLRRAQPSDKFDSLSARPCARQASRPDGDVPQGQEQVRPTEEGAGRRLRDAGTNNGQESNRRAARKGRLRGSFGERRLEG